MSNSKFIILAEVSIKQEYLEEVKALCALTLEPTLKEPGCEVFYQTSKAEDPSTLVFFEVFSSRQASDLHLEAPYTKAFFEGIKDKVAGKPVTTVLKAL